MKNLHSNEDTYPGVYLSERLMNIGGAKPSVMIFAFVKSIHEKVNFACFEPFQYFKPVSKTPILHQLVVLLNIFEQIMVLP